LGLEVGGPAFGLEATKEAQGREHSTRPLSYGARSEEQGETAKNIQPILKS